MLVSEYVLQIIEKRPYKYSTKLTNVMDNKVTWGVHDKTGNGKNSYRKQICG
jgi:hypothetical protein